MNQSRLPGLSEAASPTSQPESEQAFIDLSVIFATLWRGKYLMLAGTLIAMILGGYYVFNVATPRYSSTAVVMLESRQERVVNLDSVLGGLSRDSAVLNSEVQVLRSRTLLGSVVDQLNLTADPEFNASLRTPSLMARLRRAIRETLSGTPSVPNTPEVVPLPQDDRTQRIRNGAINALLGRLTITNVPNSLIFEVTAETEDPRKSALIADTLVDRYITNQLEVKFNATEQATTWLTSRVTDLQGELEVAEAQVKEFNASTDLISQEALSALERQLKEMRDRIGNLEQVRAERQERLAALETATTPAEKAAAAGDGLLEQMVQQAGNTGDLPPRFEVRFQELLTQARQDMQRTENQLEALTTSASNLEAQINRQNSDLITLRQLTREAEANRLLYEHFLTRLKETAAQQGIQQADSRILSNAVIPGAPSAPRKNFIIAASGVLGLLLTASLVLIREMRANTFRSNRELEAVTHHTVMGQVPLLPVQRRRDALSYLAEKPTSVAAESFRNLRTSLLLSNMDNPPQVTMITSSLPGEGKTTVSLALSQNLAGLGRKVLLIEGDIRRRVFTQYIPAPHDKGIISAVSGEVSLEEALVRDERLPNVDILLGQRSTINAADFFSSDKFSDFIDRARQEYDQIIIDTSPVLVVPDARIISRLCDAVLFVVKWDQTPRPSVHEALNMFKSVNVPVSGLVLNQINPRRLRSYGGYGYGAYSSYGYSASKYYNN